MPIRTNRTKSQRLSERRMRFLVREERLASREYHAAGLHRFGSDEAKHARYHERVLRKLR